MEGQDGKRVVVGGATGNLGRALIPALDAKGCEVVALVRPGSAGRLDSLEPHIRQVVTAEVTAPEMPAGICDGIDAVISSIGITRQREGLTYDQVDYGGNLNLLRAAERSGVSRFLYVSVIGADRDLDVPVMRAKRRFEEALAQSRLEWQIVRPSGFYTDMADILEMARKGTVHLFGDGQSRISPIHPIDLAELIADLLEGEPGAIHPVGGPADFTWNEIAELCGQVAGGRCRVRHWPEWMLRATLKVTRVASRQAYGTLSFLGYVMTNDTTAPNHGSRGLREFLEAQLDADAAAVAAQQADSP